jgi:hypothetical protein
MMDDAAGAWVDRAVGMRAKHKVQTDRTWTSQQHVLVGVPHSPRTLESLDIAYSQKPPDADWYCDLNASISRSPFGEELKMVTTRTRFYDFQQCRVLSALEMMLIMGLPAYSFVYPERMTTGDLYTAVGEAMHAPSVGTLIVACFLNKHAPWWTSSA